MNVVKKCLVGSVVSNYQVSFSDRSRRFEFGILINKPTCNELPQKVDATKSYLIESCSESMLSITVNEPLQFFKLKNLIRERS
jgi:hypothetical protein